MKENVSNSRAITRQLIQFLLWTYLSSLFLFGIGGYSGHTILIIGGVWAPTIVALISTVYYFGTDGLWRMLSRFTRWRAPWYIWGALILLPAGIHFCGRSLWQLFYYGSISYDFLSLDYWAGAILPSFLIAGFGEELGWRGFVLPRLQRLFSPLTASLMLAGVHYLWHIPTFWLGMGIHNVPLIYSLMFILPWTILFNWVYNQSKGSLLFAVGFHALSNASLSIVRFMPLESEVSIRPELITQLSLPPEWGGPYLTVVGVYWIMALAVLLFGRFDKVNTDLP